MAPLILYALCLFCFNMRQHGRQILYFNLYVDGRKFHYRRPHAAVRPQVVHRWSRLSNVLLRLFSYQWTELGMSNIHAK